MNCLNHRFTHLCRSIFKDASVLSSGTHFFNSRHNLAGRLFILWLAGILFFAASAFANNPGGFTPLVTTAVTTGTETVNGHADRYLDNGILHVSIQNNGSVDSIKYLKPGLTGTPKVNGVETVSQSGVNFGNHTAIYYYWYPDGNGDMTYLNTTTTSTNIDIAYLRTYNPASDSVAANVVCTTSWAREIPDCIRICSCASR